MEALCNDISICNIYGITAISTDYYRYIGKSWKDVFLPYVHPNYYPDMTCITTCYNEGEVIINIIRSPVEQIYKVNIEILVIIDGADVNKAIYDAALSYLEKYHSKFKNTSRYTKGNTKKSKRRQSIIK